MSQILANSQTFIGTLTTIVVLCIVSKGNFIHDILDSLKERIKQNIYNLKEALENQRLSNEEAVVKMHEKCDASNDSGAKMKRLIFDNEIGMYDVRYNTSAISDAKKRGIALIDYAHEAPEQFISPLYCFLLCLVLFVCDELGTTFPFLINPLGLFLILFNSYSLILLCVVWNVFYKRFGLMHFYKKDSNLPSDEGRLHFNRKKAFTIAVWFIYVFVYYYFARVHAYTKLDLGSVQPFCLFFDAFLIMVPLLLIFMNHDLLSEEQTYDLSYSFSILHFIYLVSVCMFVSLCVVLIDTYAFPTSIFYPTANFEIIRWSSIVIVIAFGLILPSAGPYAVFCKAEQNTKVIISDLNQKKLATRNEILGRIVEFNKSF